MVGFRNGFFGTIARQGDGAPPSYSQNLVNDASVNSITFSSPTASDSQFLTVSFWANYSGDSGTINIADFGGRTTIIRSADTIQIAVRNTSAVIVYQASYSVPSSLGFHHFHFRCDLGGTPSATWSINGSSVSPTVTVAPTTGTIDHTRTAYTIWETVSSKPISLSDFFIDFTQSIPSSSFIDSGNSVNISSVGSPAIFIGNDMTADERAGNTSQGWNDGFNLGSCGAFTVSGSFTDV